jgi:PAS domain S-box-containing protein
MLGVHTDITPRMTEDAGRLRRIVEAAPTAMLAVGPGGDIEFVNAKAEALFGYGREELLGAPIELLLPQRYASNHPQFVRAFFAAPSARPMGAQRELFARAKDGQEVPVEIGLNPIQMPDGMCVVASIIDITERRRTQDSFRRIVEGAPNAAIVVDTRGRITLVNRAAEVLFGYPREELVGEPIERLVPEDVRAQHPAHVAAFRRCPRARPMGAGRDLYGRSKDGREIPVEIGLSPIETPDGPCTLASVIDITERKVREDELRRSNAELEQFAYVASHDLQEPLRMVANYTELLADRYRGKLDERADRYIHFAVDGARRMQQLVADLLAFSRVGSQARPFARVDADIACHDVLTAMATAVTDAGAEVIVHKLPTILADASQLRQLLQNLIGNALKFRSERRPRVVVSASREGRVWRFSVADNGIGIDARHADRIFQMFQRLHARGEYDGSGIGLAIARRIVDRHGGEIWFQSTPGESTTFYFTLDAARRVPGT